MSTVIGVIVLVLLVVGAVAIASVEPKPESSRYAWEAAAKVGYRNAARARRRGDIEKAESITKAADKAREHAESMAS